MDFGSTVILLHDKLLESRGPDPSLNREHADAGYAFCPRCPKGTRMQTNLQATEHCRESNISVPEKETDKGAI